MTDRVYTVVSKFNEHTFLTVYNEQRYVLKYVAVNDIKVCAKLSAVRHINVARVFGMTQLNGHPCVVEEFVDGVTLEQYLRQNGPLSEDDAGKVAVQICRGLGALHDKGIIHRDINPNNIMVDAFLNVKIIDFDISRINSVNKKADTQILGTLGFASPEQFGFHQTGAKSDIYSLGALLNYMLTLSLPQVKLADGRFRPVISKCIQMDDNDRHENVKVLEEALTDNSGFYKFISFFPGFRSNVTWHKILSLFYYIFALFCSFVMPFCLETDQIIYFIVFFAFSLLLPVFTIGNPGHWLQRFRLTKNLSASSRVIIKILLTLFSFFIAIMAVAISPSPQ